MTTTQPISRIKTLFRPAVKCRIIPRVRTRRQTMFDRIIMNIIHLIRLHDLFRALECLKKPDKNSFFFTANPINPKHSNRETQLVVQLAVCHPATPLVIPHLMRDPFFPHPPTYHDCVPPSNSVWRCLT